MPNKTINTKLIKDHALKLGFSFVGISKAAFLETEAPKLEQWLKENKNGKMAYMENHFDKRLNPTLLVEGAKSVISLMYNYFTNDKQNDTQAPKISKYAFGQDYHDVVKEKLAQLLLFIQTNIGQVGGRCFVDSAPILERAWAAKSGLGWIGKNGNLINKGHGSFYFLAELIIDLELDYDSKLATDYCGTCTACIDACPTEAIVSPTVVDGSKCISYFTIELKDAIPTEMKGKFDNWAFGCDVCQDVCPWNRFSKPHNEPQFLAKPELLNMTNKDWLDITEQVFSQLFKKSPVKRTKYNGLKRNIDFIRN
ncbi:MAG: tRNA epoxyqueuosine(34) reductase QueG [Candidatus Methylacidiphilales bacterium]